MPAQPYELIKRSPRYAELIRKFGIQMSATEGKLNRTAFWKQEVLPLFPNFKRSSWYALSNELIKSASTSQATEILEETIPQVATVEEATDVLKTLLPSEEATRRGISFALNAGQAALQKILADPSFSIEKKAELMFKAMRAQDSRAHAIRSLRQDERDTKKFNSMFNNAAYEVNIEGDAESN